MIGAVLQTRSCAASVLKFPWDLRRRLSTVTVFVRAVASVIEISKPGQLLDALNSLLILAPQRLPYGHRRAELIGIASRAPDRARGLRGFGSFSVYG